MVSLPPFPNPVNETATRVIAGEVAVLNAFALVMRQPWLFPLLAADFAIRAVAGPRFSPLANAASRGLIPRLTLSPRPTAGPPKRFAATIGAVLMFAASGFHYLGRRRGTAGALSGVVVLFATLESAFGLCVGCKMFNLLMRMNLIPVEVCEACANINLRRDSQDVSPQE